MIETIKDHDRRDVADFLARHWGSSRIVSRGRLHQADLLPGFLIRDRGEITGLVTFRFHGDACEVVSLNSVLEGRGRGTALLDRAEDAARAVQCLRIWLVTTNDNLDALRFYQRRGYVLAAIHKDALDRSRRLKPEIPETGMFDIPLRDEIELEKILDEKA